MPRKLEQQLYHDTRIIMQSVDFMYEQLSALETALDETYKRLEKLKNASVEITNTLYAHQIPEKMLIRYDNYFCNREDGEGD